VLTKPDHGALLDHPFREGLRDLGYREGQTVVFEYGWAHGDNARFPALAREILKRKPALMVLPCGSAQQAIREINRTIPVIALCADFEHFLGEVKSLQRPGGATTGFTILAPETAGKRLELLKELQPRLSRVAILHNKVDSWQSYWSEMERVAPALGITLLRLPAVAQAGEIDGALAHAVRERAEALVTFPDATTIGAAAQIMAIAMKHRWLTAFDMPQFMAEGGLVYYGADFRELVRRMLPRYVDLILKGASPAELPIVQPTKFELVVNLKTARALGMTIPRSILLRADRVIE
jgi:putative ABC transport system substrate-binding protein